METRLIMELPEIPSLEPGSRARGSHMSVALGPGNGLPNPAPLWRPYPSRAQGFVPGKWQRVIG
jgi:hypothetical protein